jgi:hypothetical protein
MARIITSDRRDPSRQPDPIFVQACRRLSAELSNLAARMTETDDVVEAARIRDAIVRGFYGAKKSNA